MKRNVLYNMDCRKGLLLMIKEGFKVDSVITSIPYWTQRDYEIEPSIWDANPNCNHKWTEPQIDHKHTGGISPGYTGQFKDDHTHFESSSSYCIKCNAWRGVLGLEPDFNLYIKHVCDIYDLVWQVLKDYGTNWINIGDTYSSGGRSGSKEYFKKGHIQFGKIDPKGRYQAPKKVKELPQKCLCMIPQRLAIEMINRGWALRNSLIWHKPNCLPSSARDRFTVDFEYIYFFVKSTKSIYWINEKIGKAMNKKPLGTKGIENIDWEWRDCNKCLGTGIKHKKCENCEGEGWTYNTSLQPELCEYCKGKGRIKLNEECNSCKGRGIKKYNFWSGRHYYFEQQREPLSNNPATQKRYEYKIGNQENRKDINVSMVKPGKAFSKYFPQKLSKNQKTYLAKITRKNFIKNPNGNTYQQGMASKKGGFNEYLKNNKEKLYVPQGRNKRCVWNIPTKPTLESHFATFPTDLVEPMIKAGSPQFICKKCGLPKERIINLIKEESNLRNFDNIKYSKPSLDLRQSSTLLTKKVIPKIFKGYSDCECNAGYKPGIVLDPFAGLGTTLYTAWNLGRDFVGFEISKKYCKIAEKKYLSKTRYKRLLEFIEENNTKDQVNLGQFIEIEE